MNSSRRSRLMLVEQQVYLVYIGDKLGLYKAMAEFGKPISSYELAERTHTSERYVREWLANQAAGGYLTYDSNLQKYLFVPRTRYPRSD